MAIWYVDPIGGNDASAGTSFATRCKSITGVTTKTGPGVVAGDNIRIMKSADPVAVSGQSTTLWTDGSKTITLATAVTADITQSTAAWTAVGANVTCTTSTNRKLGATSASIAIAAAFTTGLAAYFPTGTLNLSGYQQVSFWIYMSAGATSADSDLSIALCSDTAGATPVNTINIPWIKATAGWNCITVDTAGALGSSIQSVGFYVNVDRGAQTFLVNNIFASKASSASDGIALTTLISPANDLWNAWWAIDSITGTTITLSQEHNYNLSVAASGTAQGYAGISTTGNQSTYTGLYKRDPTVLPSIITDSTAGGVLWGNMQKSGSTAAPITVQGGWNTTDMSTQTGDTFIATYNGLGAALQLNINFVNVETVSFTRFQYGLLCSSSAYSNVTVSAHTICACAQAGLYTTTTQGGSGSSFAIYNLVQNVNGVNATGSGATSLVLYSLNVSGNTVFGIQFSRADGSNYSSLDNLNVTVYNVRRNGQSAVGTPGTMASSGVRLGGVSNGTFTFSNIDRNYGGNLSVGYSATSACINNQIYFQSTTTDSLTVSSTNYAPLQIVDGTNNIIKLIDVSSGASIPISGGQYAIAITGNGYNNQIVGGTISGTTAAVFVLGSAITVLQNTTLASGTAVLTPTANGGKDYPITRWQNYNNSSTDHRVFLNKDASTDYNGSIATDATIRHTASGFSWKLTGGNTPVAWFTRDIELPIGQFAVKDVNTTYNVKVWVYPTSASSTVKLRVYYSSSHNILVAGPNYTETTAASTTATTWTQITLPLVVPAGATPGVYSVSVIGGSLTNATPRSLYVDDFSVSQ